MLKVSKNLAVLAIRHNTAEARNQVNKLLSNLENVPFNVTLALELNKQDAYFIFKRKYEKSEFYRALVSADTSS